MVMGQLRFATRYYGIHPRLRGAFEFLMKEDLNRPPGAYEIDGRNLVALFREYKTRSADIGSWETHNYHFDVHFLVAGEEKIGFGNRDGSKIIKPYNIKEDYDIIAPIDNPSYLTINDDGFAIFFPEEAHQPHLFSDQAKTVKKICIKVLV